MKIIWCDMFARETVADRLVADNITNLSEAREMIETLQAGCNYEACTDWYRLEEDDYVLWRGMEELV